MVIAQKCNSCGKYYKPVTRGLHCMCGGLLISIFPTVEANPEPEKVKMVAVSDLLKVANEQADLVLYVVRELVKRTSCTGKALEDSHELQAEVAKLIGMGQMLNEVDIETPDVDAALIMIRQLLNE